MAFTTIGQLPAPSSPSKTVGRAYAEKAAKTIFARYPNPKAGPEYLVELTNCLAEQPQWIVDRIADRHLGITFKHKSFVPSIGDVLDMIGVLQDQRERYRHYGETQRRKQTGIATPVHVPFRPYPRLWAAFADEPTVIEALDKAVSFDWLTEAAKIFARRGREAARQFIYPQPVDTRVTESQAA